MDFFKEISNGSIVVTPSNQKLKILKEIEKQNGLLNIKIMTFEELLKACEFDYTKETLFYLIKEKNIPLYIAKTYLKNMHYIENKKYKSGRLNNLIELKQELLDKSLLKNDAFFIKSLKNRRVFIYGYDFLLKEEYSLIEWLKKYGNVQIQGTKTYPEKTLKVYRFQTMDEEIEYVLQKICELLSTGISPKKIKLVGVSDEYKSRLQHLANLYHVPLYIPTNIPLFETEIGKTTLTLLQENQNFEEIIDALEAYKSPEILDQMITIFNQYIFLEKEPHELEELLTEDLKTTFLKKEKKEFEIEITTLKNNTFSLDDHIFLLGFNNGSFPTIHKDEEFLSDALKKELGFTTSIEKNKLEKMALMNKLFSIPNLTITYKLKTLSEIYYPSVLIEDYKMLEEEGQLDFKVHYSKKYDALKLASMLDSYIKYGKKSPLLEKYYNNISLSYLTYDHTYKKINIEELHSFLKQKLTLSYSALDCYNHCAFRYYLQNILKLTKFEDTLATKIGNLFHKILSEAFHEPFCFDEAYEREINQLILSTKEKFYLEKLKKDLEFTIEVIREQNRLTGFNNALFEEKIFIPISSTLPVTFMGIVDKILWQEKDGMKLVSIIDYKTGATNLDLRLAPYGLSLQLPTYMYLVHNSPKLKNSRICGIYLQKILNPQPTNSKDIQKDKKDALKLRGYTIDDESILEIWDSTYENSEVIKGLKKTKNGWYHYAKLLSMEEIEQLITTTEEKIKEGARNILDGDFTINPKRVNGKNIGCEFCSFKDICYQKEQDIIDLKINENSSTSKDEKEERE